MTWNGILAVIFRYFSNSLSFGVHYVSLVD